jgi:hypothetical protein
VADLLFRDPATTGSPADLVFNESFSGTVPVRISGTLPAPTGVVVLAGEPAEYEISGTIGGPTAVVLALVGLPTPEYVTARSSAPWKDGTGADTGAVAPWNHLPALLAFADTRWRDGDPLRPVSRAPWRDTVPIRPPAAPAPWREAAQLRGHTGLPWQDARTVRPPPGVAPWREGAPLRIVSRMPWREANSLRVWVDLPWRLAQANQGRHALPWQQGNHRTAATRKPWRDATGLISWGSPFPPVDPPEPPEACYTPSGFLLFRERTPFGPDLLFYCENHPTEPDATVVVPVKRIYTVLDSFLLKRVVDDVYVPAFSASLSLDRSSWTWGLTFTAPAAELAQVERDELGVPVELEAIINGVSYRFLAEKIGRSREFPSGRINVQCRGIGAALDLLSGTYSNDGDTQTAAQLMDDVLTVNGVGVGWTIEFELEDWTVPAGAWNFNGSAIDALNAIAGAAGGYLQPHPTDKIIRVLPGYPDLPWDWGTVTPDYELPSAAVVREAIEYVEMPRYTRVFVSGQATGINAQVTRTGSDGSVVAPGVVDQLITDTPAARQRGGSILANTGPQQKVSLSLPILTETGIIPPGKYVRYVDGATTRIGITRSVNVQIGSRGVGHRQTIEVECHD